MSGERTRHQHLGALFGAAADLPKNQREAFLDAQCGDDDVLRHEVLELLATLEDSADLLATGGGLQALEGNPLDSRETQEPLAAGTQLGPYRLEEPIGRGGMARVYRARRADQLFDQEVAIKVVRSPNPSRHLVQRFERERRILARLEHPNIARLLDGGVTADGRPYLVMELVDGIPIDRYCDSRGLTVRQRLQLFLQITEAVHYAHRHLVVHRDLKPSNLLVDTEGRVKLLDFGIAKLLDPSQTDGQDDLTRSSLRPLTPEWATPEQVRGEAVTTASDVYQLGLLLYVLLTGQRAYRLTGVSPMELDQAICRQHPTRPSRSIEQDSTFGSSSPTTDASWMTRANSPRRLRSQLRGDLDNIVLTALRKRPERRYGTVSAFQEDIQRYLKGMPVAARPESLSYVGRKFVQRHLVPLSTAALGLLLAMALVLFYTQRLQLERDRAQREAAKARQVQGLMTGLFESQQPWLEETRDLKMSQFLDQNLDNALQGVDDLQVRASLLSSVGRVYYALGKTERAETILYQARDAWRQVKRPDILDQARVLFSLARTRRRAGQWDDARRLFESALETLAESPNETEHLEQRLQILSHLGTTCRKGGDYTAAERYLSQASEILEREVTVEAVLQAETLTAMAELRRKQRRYDEAIPLYHQSLALHRQHYGPDHPLQAETLSNLSVALKRTGRMEESLEILQRALHLQRQAYGDDHIVLGITVMRLGSLNIEMDRLDQAEPLLLEAEQFHRRHHGEDHPNVATVLLNLAEISIRRQRYEQAHDRLHTAQQIFEDSLEPNHLWFVHPQDGFAQLALLQGRLEDAEGHYRRILELNLGTLEEDHLDVAAVRSQLAGVLCRLGRTDEATGLYRQALAVQTVELDADHSERLASETGLAQCGTMATVVSAAEE